MKTDIILAAFLLLASPLLMSCSDDTDKPQPIDASGQVIDEGGLTLAAPKLTFDITSTSIAFTWDEVRGARQYGYSLTGPSGEVIAADVTTAREFAASDLTPFTTYTVSVTAFPTVTGSADAVETVQQVSTLFWDALAGCETKYVSHISANGAIQTLRGVINEDRSASDYEANTYGVFTISGFYGHEGYDMVFTVNRNNTITILNGERGDDGMVTLVTGAKYIPLRCNDKVRIDEFSTMFNGPGRMLTFTATNSNLDDPTVSFEEVITW